MEELKQQIEEQISLMVEEGIQPSNIDSLFKMVDIHKDIENEKYWKEKIDMRKRYGNYPEYDRGNYGRRMRDSRGRYMGKGHEMIEDMREMYQEYSDGRDEYDRGNYGAKGEAMKSLEYMLESVVDFVDMLKKDAGSQEEVDLIQRYTREISEM